MNKLIIYNDFYWSLVSFNDNILKRSEYKNHKTFSSNFYTDEEKSRISLSRTKRRIKEICLTNDFEYFGTITVNSKHSDRFSLTECQEKMKKICHKLKRKNKYFKFIFITEKHKDGAFHFHGMFKSIDCYINQNGYLSNKDFDTLGFNSFDAIKDYNKCCNYITKYITKNCVKNENNQIYFCSRGLKKPSEQFIMNTDLKSIFGDKVYENDYCQKIDFDITRLSSQEKEKLYHYFNLSDTFMQQNYSSFTNWLKLLTNYKDLRII